MRQALSLIGCVIAQSFLGKGVAGGSVRPEADFALLILLSLSAGRMRGVVLGALVGAFRDALSIRPFGLGIFVLASAGFFAGFLGERRYFQRPWQKIVLIFGLFFLSDGLYFLLHS